jgi:protein involved in polysaccharide export with SLBB domain
MKYLAFLLVVFTGFGCRTKGPSFDPYGERTAQAFAPVELTNHLDQSLLKPPAEPYRLGPGDLIEIEAIGEPASRAQLTLGPDGKVYYGLLPGISLWGLSLSECRTNLQTEMAKYNRAAPDLVVNLRGAASERVWFLGAVINPGVYPLAGPTTVLEAVSAVGGLTPGIGSDDSADLSRSFILRNGKFLPVDFERLIKHGDATQNIYLAPDDFVFIRPSDKPSVYVLGAVAGSVVPYSRELTLARAILALGGPVKYAQQSRVVILRGNLAAPRIAQVNYLAIVKGQARDIPLEPGDIVYIPFTPYRLLAQLAEELVDQFVRTIAINEGSYLGAGTEQNLNVGVPLGGTSGGIFTGGTSGHNIRR